MELELLGWRWSKGGGCAGLPKGRGMDWVVWRGHCSPGLSGSKRQATSSPILFTSFCHHVVEERGG